MAGRKPGTPKTGGRQKGTTNKVTALAKDAIAAAADRLGGVDRLVEWVREDASNERVFWGQIYPKLLPLQVAGAEDAETDRVLFEVRALLKPWSALREPELASRVMSMMAPA
jgi:hypothetical protein